MRKKLSQHLCYWGCLALCIFLFSCKAKQATQSSELTDNQVIITPKVETIEEQEIKSSSTAPPVVIMPRPLPGPVLSLETTPAYGINPVFELRVFKDGLVTWLGKEDVLREGHFEARISPQEVEKWLLKAKNMGYYELADQYPEGRTLIPEFSNCITMLNHHGQQKRVVNNYAAPASLRTFEEELIAWTEGLSWQSVRAQ